VLLQVCFLVRLKGFQKLTSVEEASRRFFAAVEIKRQRTVSVSLDLALNRVLARTITAKENIPRANRSAVDGYAIRAEATIGASQFKPKAMSKTTSNRLGIKEAKQVWTGNPIPSGADAVMMLEDTKEIDGRIEVWAPLSPGENVSRKGEDMKKGDVAVEAGTRLRPQHLGLLATLGLTQVEVFECPKIGILATGNELTEIGSMRKEGQIFNANGHLVSALCLELGAEPLDLGIARDDIDDISDKLANGLSADMLVTTGGTSVGASDLVPDAVNKLGSPGVTVHGVAMRPGMPTALAVVDGKPILILPGSPVAAMISFEVFARPLICKMVGLKHLESRPILTARMERRFGTTLGRKTFVRVRVSRQDEGFFAEPISAHGSSMISTMTRSNGYVIVPEDREGLEEGELVSVHLFDDVKGTGLDV
jgi:molybdopterin molybdotransferase